MTIQNGKIVQNSCKKFDIQSKTVDFVAVYDANIISNIIFRAGGINNEGKFVSGQKEYTAQVMFGTSNYQSGPKPISDAQMRCLIGYGYEESQIKGMTSKQASDLIGQLKGNR